MDCKSHLRQVTCCWLCASPIELLDAESTVPALIWLELAQGLWPACGTESGVKDRHHLPLPRPRPLNLHAQPRMERLYTHCAWRAQRSSE